MIREKKNNKSGITLVALVVTIVVLIILAGVSIKLVVSDNGIINKTKNAASASNEESQNTEQSINDIVDQYWSK